MSTTPSAGPAKFLAVGTFPAPLTPAQNQALLPKQVPAVLKLYVDGKGVVFIMTTESADEAQTLLEALPFGQAKLMEFILIPIGPLTPLGRLIPAV